MASQSRPEPRSLILDPLHRALGARMVPFAGYAMPVQYAGLMAEHAHCRSQGGAALFDVSHMGQVLLTSPDADRKLESLVVGDIVGLAPGEGRYTLFTNENGGILDDLIVTRRDDGLFVVVNAAVRQADIARLQSVTHVEELAEHALLAFQGPGALVALARLAPECAALAFMGGTYAQIAGVDVWISRSGYTGEDGFEISVAGDDARHLAETLLAQPEVKPAGLGARDTLRLEAGLCLYGHDIDTATSPVEARLAWTIGKRRREAKDFPGADTIIEQIATGTQRKRVGLVFEGRAPVREGATLVAPDTAAPIGTVTSGTYSPTRGEPIAMGYVEAEHAPLEQPVAAQVRGRHIQGRVAPMPFVPHRFYRG